MKIKGKYNVANVYASVIDESTKKQIQELMDLKIMRGLKIAIMADAHAGKGCVIGTTIQLKDKVIPNLVGVDIGCGMYTYFLNTKEINLILLDRFIRKKIPSGNNVRNEAIKSDLNLKELYCFKSLKKYNYILNSMGTLGGGNHFIEIDKDEDNNLYLIVHSGSRNLGHQVCQIYQDLAIKKQQERINKNKKALIYRYKKANKEEKLNNALLKFNEKYKNLKDDLAYLDKKDFQNYIHDMKICQQYASENRICIVKEICKFLNVPFQSELGFETIHNYIDCEQKILRKGSISALKNETVLIPINMRDGCIIAKGKSNKNYNYSAPHGAGRILSRKEAREKISVEDYKKSMEGIYSTAINISTIDESCFAYKSIDDIIKNILPTVDIIKIIKPIYNFKAGNRSR